MSGYIGTQPVPQATQTRDSFTCTAGQTSFATSGYSPNFLDVYLNGVKLTATDYTASNGSDVVLASGAATGDVLEVVAFTTFDVVTDTITAAGTALTLDRTGSDGTILDLKKDGSTVGSIGAVASQDIVIGSGVAGLRFLSTGPAIQPRNSNGSSNNDAIDLGLAGNRFKDLYLSGGVYLGGTGSANKLDDYEEGTWTPVLADAISGGNTSSSSFTGQYTKIGNLVHISVSMFNINTTGMTAGNVMYIRGLPFTAIAGHNSQGSCTLDRINFTGFVSAQIAAGQSYMFLNDMVDSGLEVLLTVASVVSSGGSDISISATYRV